MTRPFLFAAAALLLSGPIAQAAPAMVVTANPLVLPAPDRGDDLQVRVTAPATGRMLPIIVFAHGAKYTKDDYQPLAEYWAANGFVVIQPTFLDADALNLPPTDPRSRIFWRARPQDMTRVLDQLDRIEAMTPGLKGRLNRSRIAAVGHSYGGHTVEALLGARVNDPATGRRVDLSDRRFRVGVMLSPPGQGGTSGPQPNPEWARRTGYLDVSFAEMTRPALVVVGSEDKASTEPRGAAWHADAYNQAGGGKCLWTIAGAGHWLGGIGGARHSETTDENPARVAAVEGVTLAYLKSALDPADPAWPQARRKLTETPAPGDRFECK